MRLTKAQKAKLLEWVAEGLLTGEINKRAANEPEAFTVSKTLVDYYRRSRKVDISARIQADEDSALKRGIAVREQRVAILQEIGDRLLEFVREGSLWVTDIKAAGGEMVQVERFNAPLVSELRATLADAAAEMGDRKTNVKVGGDRDNPLEVTHFYIPDNGRGGPRP